MADRIILRSNGDSDFYELIGRYLSRREIIKELGFPVWDEDDRIWFIYIKDGDVIGFFAYNTKRHITGSLYVIPSMRSKGIGNKLGKIMHEYIKKQYSPVQVSAMVRSEAIGIYENLGYQKLNKKGKYTKMIISYE